MSLHLHPRQYPRRPLCPPVVPLAPAYPGTCREQHHPTGALRLNIAKATANLPDLSFTETGILHRFNPRS